jgi:hypothetical protein
MSQLISYLSSPSQNCSVKAIAPVVGQSFINVAAASGATATDLFTTLATGAKPFASGQIQNATCGDLEVTLTYLDSQDCNLCTSETITTSVKTVIVPKNSVFPLPTGLISAASFKTGTQVGSTFTASNLNVAGNVTWYSEYQPGCADSGCNVLVP